AYNVFPPLQSILGYVVTGLFSGDARSPGFPVLRVSALVLFGLPLPIVGYAVFRRRTGSDFWAGVFTLGWLGGTAVLPCIDEARVGGVHHINHLLSQVGLLLLAGELLDPARRRCWIGWLGLLIAVWSRQLTVVYGVVLLIAVWRDETGSSGPNACNRRAPDEEPRASARAAARIPTVSTSANNRLGCHGSTLTRNRVFIIAGLLVILVVPMGLNWAKFGNPFRSGYEFIYVGRDTEIAEDARTHGLFSTAFVARNGWYMNAALPWTRSGEAGAITWNPSLHGTSIWLTTPLLALVLIGVSGWWRELNSRRLMLCSLLIIAALLLYHNTGYRQIGYWRFALDFVPVWLVVGARSLSCGRLRWATLVCVAWSVGYFAILGRLIGS
ncbi:MAG: hypothetical protein ACE5EC_06485, partial [Phycisphaerae bacterium]